MSAVKTTILPRGRHYVGYIQAEYNGTSWAYRIVGVNRSRLMARLSAKAAMFFAVAAD